MPVELLRIYLPTSSISLVFVAFAGLKVADTKVGRSRSMTKSDIGTAASEILLRRVNYVQL
jgi:hypothetical protein